MRFEPTNLREVVQVFLEPHFDERGWFARAWSGDEFTALGLGFEWVQANLAHNTAAGTLRGVHLQLAPHAEAKFVRCTRGSLYDVAVDLRRWSPTFGRWVGTVMTAEAGNGLLIPPGFGHGYLTLQSDTDLYYQSSAEYQPESATGARFDDPDLNIEWPAPVSTISAADKSWPLLSARHDL